jgi:hypothetical protein
MIDMNKTAFDSAFSTMTMIQDQMEKIIDMYLNQASGMDSESRKALAEWSKIYRNGFEAFKKTVDENFKRVESFFPRQG